ncbi:MAG: hypothetical protein OET90_05060 [Desulfuromonadales bacterium]|nr:hypothetical protein [Desulfuromonadales bacterium]
MAWNIIEWSREHGRGRIAGTKASPLDFDASVALVDDFRIGEEVHIEIERQGDTWKVTKVTPDDPRFLARESAPVEVPALAKDLEQEAQKVLNKVQLQELYHLASINESSLVLLGEVPDTYPPPADKIVLDGLSYVESACCIEIKSIRLARPPEREYLATRLADEEISSDELAITIVDQSNRFHFIVCSSMQYIPSR